MSKKTKRSKKTSRQVSPQWLDAWFQQMNSQLLGRNFEGAISTCQRLLGILPKNAPERAAVLANLGTSNAMLQNYPESYTNFTEALALEPDAADLWYGRGIASRHTGRNL